MAENSNINTTIRDISASDSIKDCNNAESGKCYNVYNSALHTPFTTSIGMLFTYGRTAYKRQTISDGTKMYIRACNNNVWTNWEELALNNQLIKSVNIGTFTITRGSHASIAVPTDKVPASSNLVNVYQAWYNDSTQLDLSFAIIKKSDGWGLGYSVPGTGTFSVSLVAYYYD